jgi:hypothetical protein
MKQWCRSETLLLILTNCTSQYSRGMQQLTPEICSSDLYTLSSLQENICNLRMYFHTNSINTSMRFSFMEFTGRRERKRAHLVVDSYSIAALVTYDPLMSATWTSCMDWKLILGLDKGVIEFEEFSMLGYYSVSLIVFIINSSERFQCVQIFLSEQWMHDDRWISVVIHILVRKKHSYHRMVDWFQSNAIFGIKE